MAEINKSLLDIESDIKPITRIEEIKNTIKTKHKDRLRNPEKYLIIGTGICKDTVKVSRSSAVLLNYAEALLDLAT